MNSMYLQRFQHYVEIIQRHMTALQQQSTEAADDEIESAFNGLELLLEEVETSQEAAQIIEEELLQRIQQLTKYYEEARAVQAELVQEIQLLTEDSQHYQTLFQAAPIAYLVTDANGLIQEANQAFATLLKVPQRQLIRKPLAVFVAKEDWPAFRSYFQHLRQSEGVQTWQMRLTSPQQDPVDTELQVAIGRDATGAVQTLQIAVHDLTQTYQRISQLSQIQRLEKLSENAPALPQALDGLRVLFVDDEADAREFVTAVLEAQGIHVTAVDSAAAALEALEHSRPDVLVSDIRMADQDGYALIRRVRELEAEQGWHVPAAALTAYLNESREKALAAGFEAHLHKLARPDELIALVNRLSEQQAIL